MTQHTNHALRLLSATILLLFSRGIASSHMPVLSASQPAPADSAASTAPTAQDPNTPAPLPRPTNLHAESVDYHQARLAWSPVRIPGRTIRYKLYRNNDPEPAGWCYSARYTDRGLSPGTTYSYRVKAYDADTGDSSMSDWLTITTKQPPQTSITLTNPSFENAVDDDDAPFGWHGPLGSGRGQLDHTIAHTGTRSYRVIGTGEWGYLEQTIALAPATHYRIRCWVRLEQVSHDNGLGMRYVELKPKTIIHRSPWAHGTSDWRQLSYSFQTTKTMIHGRLDLLWDMSSGTGWFDDVAIQAAIDTDDGA